MIIKKEKGVLTNKIISKVCVGGGGEGGEFLAENKREVFIAY